MKNYRERSLRWRWRESARLAQLTFAWGLADAADEPLRYSQVLFVTTWAFTVCFAVWTMFGVTGYPDRAQLNLDFDRSSGFSPPRLS